MIGGIVYGSTHLISSTKQFWDNQTQQILSLERQIWHCQYTVQLYSILLPSMPASCSSFIIPVQSAFDVQFVDAYLTGYFAEQLLQVVEVAGDP